MSKTLEAYNTKPMVIVYMDSEGELYEQNYLDLAESGTLIDPETGDDMEIVGWAAL